MKLARNALVFLCYSAMGFAATSAEAPRLKPGLWQMHIQSSAAGAISALPPTVCVGAMSDEQRQIELNNIKSRCNKYESREMGGKWVVDAVCTARNVAVTKHTVTSLGGDSFREENTGPQGSMTSEGKWLGACKPGQSPDTFK